MSPGRMKAMRERYAAPKVFVESGTFHGKTTRFAVEQFDVVHTIELNTDWFMAALKELAPLGVHCHHGNSADVIPKLARQIEGPVFWYLDAHWFKVAPNVAGKDLPLPLWAELEAISQRTEPDVIVVDDVHSFGKSEPTPEWEKVNLDSIAAHFPERKEALLMWDQAVVYR
jgi:hypothetical protein